MKNIGVGVIGFGTVGAGVAEGLLKGASLLTRRCGVNVELRAIADLDITTDRGVSVPQEILTTNALDVTQRDDIDIVVELIGGTTIAYEVIRKALENKKSVVTANKKLLAEKGEELTAEEKEQARQEAIKAYQAEQMRIMQNRNNKPKVTKPQPSTPQPSLFDF